MFHPDHVGKCRNKTFWENRTHCPEGYVPCNGNFPGLCQKLTTFLPSDKVIVGNMTANETKTYLLSCDGKCNNITVTVESGDVGLFYREGEPFKIEVRK